MIILFPEDFAFRQQQDTCETHILLLASIIINTRLEKWQRKWKKIPKEQIQLAFENDKVQDLYLSTYITRKDVVNNNFQCQLVFEKKPKLSTLLTEMQNIVHFRDILSIPVQNL